MAGRSRPVIWVAKTERNVEAILKAIELFAGIGGFRIACEKLGIETIWANDIDKKACEVYRENFGENAIHEGDIRLLKDHIPNHDILTAGFPCQPFSGAGKKQGIRDPRGTLFQEIVDVITKRNPKIFVLENVKRLLSMENGQHFTTILDTFSSLGYLLEWRLLNAFNFGLPQNRERVIIVGTKNGHSPVSHLLTSSDSKSIPNQIAGRFLEPFAWSPINEHSNHFFNWGIAIDGRFISCDIETFSEKKTPKCLIDILEKDVDASFDFTEDTLSRLPNSQRIDKFVNGVEIVYNQGGGARMGYTIFGTKGIAPTLTSSTSRHYERYLIDGKYRRLTNIEYARLQGFKDDHCKGVSVYDQYILFGNAVPPPMVYWVLERLINNKTVVPKCTASQMELFI
jgi:DNA (cytosine-5)-methyltransferase 1